MTTDTPGVDIGEIRSAFRTALVSLGIKPADATRATDLFTAVIPRALTKLAPEETNKLRAERDLYRDAVVHMLALAPDEYRQAITAARASHAYHDRMRHNGWAEAIRQFATGLAERAGLPVPDWEQIKQGIPADGVYRTTEATR